MKSLVVLVALCSQLIFAASDKKLKSISVMTYNLENFFDTKHDLGKKDWTYLPLAFKVTSPEVQKHCRSIPNDHYRRSCFKLDWNHLVLDKKMINLAKVIKSYRSGEGADILVFQEVENKEVLKSLFKKHLRKMGYDYFSLIEGPDSRGIDVAVVSRFPILKDKAHDVALKPYSRRFTRPILEVVIKAYRKQITIFANHWPSQMNSDATRMVAAEKLREISLKSKSHLVVATGDFNTVDNDLLNGIRDHILPIYEDVEVKGRYFTNEDAQGTHWYRGSWSSLDKIFVLKNSLIKNHVSVNYGSFDIINWNYMLRDVSWEDEEGQSYFSPGVPMRFNSKNGEGYSDHLPVVVEFDI